MDKFEDKVTPEQLKEEYEWVIDTFPALHKYKTEHNTDNLQKLCVEVSEFCRAIYASTQNRNEKEIFKKMIDKIKML
jgi:hypothetical protein